MTQPVHTAQAPTVDHVWAALDTLTDPEIPVVTLREMGILRDVVWQNDGILAVIITPTYSGCPAMGQIEDDVKALLQANGLQGQVVTQLAPAWTTDWITEGKNVGKKNETTPVEQIAASAPAVEPAPPPPTPPAANDGETVTVTLSGEAANNFKTNLRLINNVARLTNGRQLDESALVAMAIGRLTDELMGGAA